MNPRTESIAVKRTPMMIGSWAIALALAAQTPAPRMVGETFTPVTASVPDDPALAKVIAPLAQEIQTSFGRVIVKCPTGIGKGRGMGDSPIGFLLADVMREGAAKVVGAEVRFAYTNSGGLRRTIPAGDVKVQDVYEVLPFDNELVVAEYTGAELIQIVKEGILRRGGEPCSGIKASLTGTPAQPVLSITFSDGTAIDPAKTYKAATTDYLYANGDGTPTLKVGRNLVLTGTPVRQLVIDTCETLGKQGKQLLLPEAPRYTFSPDIAEALKAKTFKF